MVIREGKAQAATGEPVANQQTSTHRAEEIRAFAAKLADAAILNIPATRARCRAFAERIIELLDEEEVCQRPVQGYAGDLSDGRRRLAEALLGCVEAGEQAELTRLNCLSERVALHARGQ